MQGLTSKLVRSIAVCGAMGLLSNTALAADAFPSKPIRVITAEPGGGNDFVARLVASGLAANWGSPVVVENRGGASGALAAQAVSKAAPDGYTIMLYSGSLWIFPLLATDVQWNPFTDFAPLSLVAQAPNVVVVPVSLPVNSIKDLIALAKAKPGQLNYVSGSTGASTHLAVELFKSMAGVDIVRIAYKGNAAGYKDLAEGRTQVMFATVAGAMPLIKAGKLRALAVSSTEPSVLLPGLTTVSAAGLPGYESTSMYGMFAPAKTPAAIITQLNKEIVLTVKSEDIKEKFLGAGVEPVGSTPQQLTAAMKSESTRLGKVIKDAGIRAEQE